MDAAVAGRLPCFHVAWPAVRRSLEQLAKGRAAPRDCEDVLAEAREALGVPQPRTRHSTFFAQADVLGGVSLSPACRLASLLPEVLHASNARPEDALRLLRAGNAGSVSLSRAAAASLVASAFLCLTDAPWSATLPCFSFHDFFSSARPGDAHHAAQAHKARCFMAFFDSVLDGADASDVITFARLVLPTPLSPASWADSPLLLRLLRVHADGCIEDSSAQLKVDFANRFLGGGVLEAGRVQEELLFSVRPEMCAGMLFCEAMRDDEAISISGAQRPSSAFEGYANSFRWTGATAPPSAADTVRGSREVWVAIDALCAPGRAQYTPDAVLREANKALAGFSLSTAGACLSVGAADAASCAVATGNWGCGAFGGDVQLKALIQWAAASQSGLDVEYYSFKDPAAAGLERAVAMIQGGGVATVGALMRLLLHPRATASHGGLWDALAQELQRVEHKSIVV